MIHSHCATEPFENLRKISDRRWTTKDSSERYSVFIEEDAGLHTKSILRRNPAVLFMQKEAHGAPTRGWMFTFFADITQHQLSLSQKQTETALRSAPRSTAMFGPSKRECDKEKSISTLNVKWRFAYFRESGKWKLLDSRFTEKSN